ncbi:putative endonuclease [Mumia flava]|uniref:UPF0102 protein CLV56_0523 n=1 Tax=Mumia flava TaxID=1348852 RepID=A0A0B2BLP2_9ACTN|nr:YraN family protein [Mumia flava]PJJ56317.1 putative endonuclease [Mumia flava]
MGSTYEQRRALGTYGEDLAVAYLRGQGMEILLRNWRVREGEVDVVARDGATLVVCEVKTRRGEAYGSALEAVTDNKAARLRRLLGRLLDETGWHPGEVRIDVVAVQVPRRGAPTLTHLEGVG